MVGDVLKQQQTKTYCSMLLLSFFTLMGHY